MALTLFHVPHFAPSADTLSTLGVTTSTLLPNRLHFKLAIDSTAASGVGIFFDEAFWSCFHTGLDVDGSTAATGKIFYAVGSTLPTASYAATTTQATSSIPILSGTDELVHIVPSENYGMIRFWAATGAPVMLFRRNEMGVRARE